MQRLANDRIAKPSRVACARTHETGTHAGTASAASAGPPCVHSSAAPTGTTSSATAQLHPQHEAWRSGPIRPATSLPWARPTPKTMIPISRTTAPKLPWPLAA